MTKRYQKSTDFRLGRGQNVLTAAEALGLKMPKAVDEARKRLAALTARQRALVTDTEARNATVALLLDDPDADLTAAATAEITRDVTAGALGRAVDLVKAEITALAMQYSDELLADARTRVFEPAVVVLVRAAALEPGATLAGLVTAKRSTEAETFTAAAAAAEQVRAAFRFRSTIYRNEDGGFPHRRWGNPQDLDLHALAELAGLDYFLAGIRQGGTLVLLDLHDLDGRARTWEAEQKAREAEAAQALKHKRTANRAAQSDRTKQLEERKQKSARRRRAA